MWVSSQGGEQVIIDLGRTETFRMMYYGGICNTNFDVALSNDGVNWTEDVGAMYKQGEIFRWLYFRPVDADQNVIYQNDVNPGDGSAYMRYTTLEDEYPLQTARYVRLTAKSAGLKLCEVGFRNAENELIEVRDVSRSNALESFATDPLNLIDEQNTVPEARSYFNSTYFDEIYHARTAYEMLHGEYAYEWTHPPLGKVLMMAGIAIFGMNPFGWRFMGTLCGVLMLPILYVFLKNLFGRTAVAACTTVVFAFDFMHFVQTRIATIDSYTVFFVLLMFWLMYRWFTQPLDAPHRKTAPWLFAAGAAFGVGAACKWSVIYGGVGLALVWLLRMVMLFRYRGKRAILPFVATVFQSIAFFVLVPVLVYYLSYQPYGAVEGCGIFSREYFDIVWENQLYMFNYHSGLEATHPYESRWWQWILDIRPILYYLEYFDDNTKSAFGAFGNPLFWWTGLGCMISLAVTTVRRRDAVGLLILIGWLANILPWLGIQRCAFVYHYFPCTIFLALAVGWQMEGMCRAKEAQLRLSRGNIKRLSPLQRCDAMIFVFAALCVVMFVLFYPVLSGIRFSREYTTNLLRWFGGRYPF